MGREQDTAEALALDALGWIASDEAMIGQFMAGAGLSPDDLRQRAGDADVMAAAVDFLLEEDQRVIAFCSATGRRPDMPGRARAFLAGGDTPHWT